MKPLSTLLFILALAAAAVAATPPAWDHVKVERRDGTALEDVRLAWVLDGYLLEATAADGSVTTLAPTHVLAVRAADGRDLTAEVGDACPATDVDFRLLGDDARVPFDFGLMVDLGGALALSAAREGGAPRPVLLGGLRAAVGSGAHIRVGLRRQGLVQGAPLGGPVRESASTDFCLLVGGRILHPRENDNYPYVEAGVMLVRFDERFRGDDGRSPSTVMNAAAFLAQGGAVLPLWPGRGLDVGAAVAIRPPLIEGAGVVYEFSVNVALAWRRGSAPD